MAKKTKKTTPKKPSAMHTLNNLLASIMMAAETLSRGLLGTLNAQQKKYVTLILTESKKIKEAIKKLQEE